MEESRSINLPSPPESVSRMRESEIGDGDSEKWRRSEKNISLMSGDEGRRHRVRGGEEKRTPTLHFSRISFYDDDER